MTQPIRHAKPAKRVCAHNSYRMTCDMYETLRADAEGRCQVCDRPEREAPRQALVIDHDHDLGWWAVRGLLCSTCNSTRVPLANSCVQVKRYLADPWHRRGLGIDPRIPDEPPVGARAFYRARRWARQADAWYTLDRFRRQSYTWQSLHYMYGAHNLTLKIPD